MGNFTFENHGANSFLVYTIEDGSMLDALSLGMLTNNAIEGLVPLVYSQMDNVKYLKYNISSKISLQQFFQGVVNRRQIIGVFLSITKAMLLAEEYMLVPGSMIFDMDRIYIEVGQCTAQLICLPLLNKNSSIEMGSFFKNIIFSVSYDQNENCDYVTKIINYLNSAKGNFSLLEFKRLLEQLKYVEKKEASASQNNVLQSAMKEHVQVQETMNVPPQKVQNVVKVPHEKPQNTMPQPLKRTFVREKEEKAAMKIPNTRVSGPGSDSLNAAVPTASSKKEKKSKLWPFGKKEKRVAQPPKQQKTPNMKIPGQKPQGMAIPGQGGMSIPGQGGMSIPNQGEVPIPNQAVSGSFAGAEAKQGAVQEVNHQMASPIAQPVTAPPVDLMQGGHANFGDTVMFQSDMEVAATTVLSVEPDRNAARQPYLLRKKTGEQIPIKVPQFKIGREPSFVDYCISDNPVISKSHAMILSRSGQFYVVDTNSKNHTFLNDTMITSNEEKLLTEGCMIKLGNEEFEFCML